MNPRDIEKTYQELQGRSRYIHTQLKRPEIKKNTHKKNAYDQELARINKLSNHIKHLSTYARIDYAIILHARTREEYAVERTKILMASTISEIGPRDVLEGRSMDDHYNALVDYVECYNTVYIGPLKAAAEQGSVLWEMSKILKGESAYEVVEVGNLNPRPFELSFTIETIIYLPEQPTKVINTVFDAKKVKQMMKRIRVDAEEAPEINGYERIPSGDFGCATELLWRFGSSARLNTSPREIFERLAKPYENEFKTDCIDSYDEFTDDKPTEKKPILPGVSLWDVYSYIKQYMPQDLVTFEFLKNRNQIEVNREKFSDTIRPRGQFKVIVHNNHFYLPIKENKVPKIPEQMQYEIKTLGHYEERFLDYSDLIKPNDCTTIVGNCNMRDLIQWIYDTKNFIPTITMNGSEIFGIKINEHTIIAEDFITERKAMIETLAVQYPDRQEFHSFTNQSWTRITRVLASYSIDLHEMASYDSEHDRAIINCFNTTHIIGKYEEQTPAFLVDLKRCYYRCITETTNEKIGIFRSVNSFVPFNGSYIDAEAEYVVECFKYCGIPVKSQIYTGHTARKLINMGCITLESIKLERRPSRVYEIKNIREMFIGWATKYPKEIKFLYTSFLGYCGIRSNKSQLEYLTSSEEEFNTRLQEGWSGAPLLPKTPAKLYLLHRVIKDQDILENLNPLFRFAVGEGIVRLLKLSKTLELLGLKTVGTRVDCCYVVPFQLNEKNETETTELEMSVMNAVSGYAGIEHKKSYLKKIKTDNDNYETTLSRIDKDYLKISGILLDGPAGSGKSYQMIKEIQAQPNNTVLCLSVMRVILQRLKKGIESLTEEEEEDLNTYGIDFEKRTQLYENFAMLRKLQQWNVMFSANTFATHKKNTKNRRIYDALVKKVKYIAVDEYSMMGGRDWDALYRLIRDINLAQGITPTLIVAGDSQQIPPIKEQYVPVDVLQSWGLTLVKKEFIPGCGRYDFYPELQSFLNSWILPPAILDRVFPIEKVLEMHHTISIAKYRDTRDKVIQHKQSIGVPDDLVMVSVNSKRNGLIHYDNGEIMTRDQAIHRQIPASDYTSALCFTSHKIQGETIECDYGIYDVTEMSLQQLYVCLSRPRSLNQIYIAGNRDELEYHVFKPFYDKPHDLNPTIISCQLDKIYEILDPVNRTVYIGRTDCIERREKEHKESGKLTDTATIQTIVTCLATDVKAVEAHMIRRYWVRVQTDNDPLFGYQLTNDKEVPRFVNTKQVSFDKTSLEATHPTNETELSPAQHIEEFYKRQDDNKIRRIKIVTLPNKYVCSVDRRDKGIRFTKTNEKIVTLISEVSEILRGSYPNF